MTRLGVFRLYYGIFRAEGIYRATAIAVREALKPIKF